MQVLVLDQGRVGDGVYVKFYVAQLIVFYQDVLVELGHLALVVQVVYLVEGELRSLLEIVLVELDVVGQLGLVVHAVALDHLLVPLKNNCKIK